MNSVNASNKLLVLIDGRSVYTPFFSSVFWDQQDVMLADVERIEVISGPGGTLWGANAMNGVINVITKSSADTQGGLVDAKVGDFVQRGAGRWGGKLGDAGDLSRLRAGLRRRPYGLSPTAAARWTIGAASRPGFAPTCRRCAADSPFRATSTKTSSTRPAAGAAAATCSGAGTSDSPTASSLQVQAYYDQQERSDVAATRRRVLRRASRRSTCEAEHVFTSAGATPDRLGRWASELGRSFRQHGESVHARSRERDTQPDESLRARTRSRLRDDCQADPRHASSNTAPSAAGP